MSNALFDADEYGEPIRLRDRYIVPPFTVLERRGGWWQGRRRMYVDAGIASNIGREGVRTFGSDGATDDVSMKIDAVSGGLSIFDPVLSEIINRWWMVPDAIVVDPFAGGSVRGIVSGMWGRHYIGIDISPKQLTANRQQLHTMRNEIAPGTNVTWIDGDAMDELRSMPAGTATGGVYTCPPLLRPRGLHRRPPRPIDVGTGPVRRVHGRTHGRTIPGARRRHVRRVGGR